MPSTVPSPQNDDLPAWLTEPEDYRPGTDRDGFLTRSLLSMTSVLTQLRLDGGTPSRFSPAAPVKLLLCVASILLVSLARNYLFVLIVLALVLARACLLPARVLSRVAAGAAGAAGLAFAIMLPAALIGQPRSALLLGTKALVCTSIALITALTTPHAQLTGALRSFGVPSLVIMTVDLTLRSIVSLGSTAAEALTALRLRSVGRNTHKQASIGGIGGVVFLKASACAQDTLDAMHCRGFDGEYQVSSRQALRGIDALWIAGLVLLGLLFAHLQGAL